MLFNVIKEFADKHSDMIVCLILRVSTLTLYNQTQGYDFINYDDGLYVYENQQLQNGFSLDAVVWAFTSNQGGNWHPLTWFSYMIDYHLYGLNPGRYHLTNFVFHIINTLLLFILLKKMTNALWRSAFVAALFALHPLHVESVAWISERKDLLSTFFWMLTVLCYISYVKYPNILRLVTVVIFYCFALMSKPMVITLPFVLLLLDFWPLERFQFHRTTQTNHSLIKSTVLALILEKIPLLVVMIIFCEVSIHAQKHVRAVIPLDWLPLHVRFGNALISYATYIVKMFFPVNLALFYPYSEIFTWGKVVCAFLLITSITFFVVIKMKRMPYLFVGWLWYIGTLVPVIGIVQVGVQSMADRYTYIPLVGLFIILSWGIPELLSNLKVHKIFFPFLATIIFSILMILTWYQIKYWKNSITIFSHSLKVTTNNFLAHNNLGIALIYQGHVREGIDHFQQALKILPSYGEANYNMGLALSSRGDFQEAIPYFQEAVRNEPACEEYRTNLSFAVRQQHVINEAMNHSSPVSHLNSEEMQSHKLENK
jgi:protein O-mannosyl-transferase